MCLCRNSSSILSRVADLIPFIFSVATVYVCDVCWIGLSLRRGYNFCGVTWRILLRVRSRCVGISLSIRGFLLRFVLSVSVDICISSSGKESSVFA